jgi:hypothetical protein
MLSSSYCHILAAAAEVTESLGAWVGVFTLADQIQQRWYYKHLGHGRISDPP